MKTTAFVTHSDCSRHDPGWNSLDHQGRLPGVARAVYRDMLTLFEPLLELEARLAEREDLELFHTADYVERVRRAAAEAERAGRVLPFESDVVVSGASWDAARAATGAVLTAVDAVLDGAARNAFCSVRPPGHGAGPAGAGEHSLFNHVAVAARHLRERHGLPRVLVVEWAGRAGRGTAQLPALDAGVRFLSVHGPRTEGAAHWPEGSIPVALPAGSGAADLLPALAAALDREAERFAPDFVLLSAGLDVLAAEPGGGLTLSPADVHPLTRLVVERAETLCGGRLVSSLEGGSDARAIGAAAVQHLRALAGLPAA